jgi:hypothetical protein
VNDFNLAMDKWSDGDYEAAAELFTRCLGDSGADAVNSIHYLAGCIGKMENGSFTDLRTLLLNVAAEQTDPEVARVARRFATNCYTELGRYEDAMAEYDYARVHAASVYDSVSAVVDYLAVAELATEGVKVNGVTADTRELTRQAYQRLESYQAEKAGLASEYLLTEAYPNPFNNTTTIRFNLPEDARIKLTVHDVMGREVTTLVSGTQYAGTHSVIWNGMNRSGVPVSSGTYYYRIESDKFTQVKKMTLIK